MSKIAVVGCGWMGTAIVVALHKLGHELVLVEHAKPNCKVAREKWESLGLDLPKFHSRFDSRFFHGGNNDDIDLVVSAAPYQVNWGIAKLCIENGIDYCDLGGNPKISSDIQNFAAAKNRNRVFTDLGLAPGYVNIIAEHIADTNPKLRNLALFCGGLPQCPQGRLRYNLVFSAEGLVNEYTGKCRILKDGEVVEVDAMTGCTPWDSLEAFYTKGGLSQTLESMQKRGLQNCAYKTVRFKGHADYIRFLIEDLKMSNSELVDWLSQACPPTKQDIVYIGAGYWNEGENIEHKISTIIPNTQTWTAMQIGTAFPAAAVASIMADTGGIGGAVLSYADINYENCLGVLKVIDDKTPWELENV